ncbi:hypothetical protein [Vreelandella titanicae]|uniref:hypothetical protein n=1 Tax=Vreelandella titanicae TaxID=664683 RepID=UPI0039BF8DA9
MKKIFIILGIISTVAFLITWYEKITEFEEELELSIGGPIKNIENLGQTCLNEIGDAYNNYTSICPNIVEILALQLVAELWIEKLTPSFLSFLDIGIKEPLLVSECKNSREIVKNQCPDFFKSSE